MHRNSAALGPWARRIWLAPLLLALFGCGGGGGGASAGGAPDATAGATADATSGTTAGTTADGTPDATPAPASAPATPVPAGLQGQWETILTYVPPFYSGPYGDVPPGDGSIGVMFFFWPDGRYQHRRILSAAYFGGNCFRTSQWDESGTVSSAGDDYTFNPGKATYVATDTCGKNQYVDPVPVSPGTHTLKLDQDGSGWPLLRMSYGSSELVLEKCRHCQ
jgi:hypothetical protein